MKFRYEDFDLSGIRTYPLASRKSKANAADFATPYRPGTGVRSFVDSLPRILAAADFKAVVAAIRAAREHDRGIIWGLGAHVIKTGLGPILIDLMERGFVSALATNGAGIIHDFELALGGSTSEDVVTYASCIRARTAAAACCSCSGFFHACRKQIATARTPSSAN